MSDNDGSKKRHEYATSTRELEAQYKACDNPVTRSVIRSIIKNREQRAEE